jgi:hypothetical protein
MATFEEQYQDVLQNIESGITSVYRANPGLTDHSVMRVLESLVDDYKGDKIGRPPRAVPFSELEGCLKEVMRNACQWRLGREALEGVRGATPDMKPKPVTVDEIILCLKRIHKSAKTWNKDGGAQGYLNFVVDYVI